MTHIETVKNKMHKMPWDFDGIMTAIGLGSCVVLLPILIINFTLILRGSIEDRRSGEIGYIPLVAQADFVECGIRKGDLVICQAAQDQDIVAGDVIAYYESAGGETLVLTSQVFSVTVEDGDLYYAVEANGDETLVPAGNLVGIYSRRIVGLGNLAGFMQTVAGLLICVAVSVMVLFGYDALRRRRCAKRHAKSTDALQSELRILQTERAKHPVRPIDPWDDLW